ncbi:MAG: hypothetical protein PHN89_02775 [Candidatus Pacebacteria bacterium]|nr:hypothetical protein [Candidatus Paceibacterota bacterium]
MAEELKNEANWEKYASHYRELCFQKDEQVKDLKKENEKVWIMVFIMSVALTSMAIATCWALTVKS